MENEKKYKEEVVRATKLWERGDITRENLEYIFPELKESEDEKMWKLIKKYAHYNISDMALETDHITREQLESWLEKQGEIDLEHYKDGENEKREFVGYGFLKCKGDFLSFKEGETYWLEYVGKDNYNVRSDNLLGQTFHITPQQLYTVFRPTTWLEKQGESKYIPKYKIGDYVKNTNYKGEPIYEIIYMDKECYICEYRGKERMGDKAVMHFSFDNPYLRLVQKPVDKAEPKFHEGDWVTNSIETVQITGYDIDYGYQVNYKGKLLHRDTDIIEKEYHLWTIKDAKDGDVLASGHLVFIFKVIHGVWLNCHCSAHNDGSFIADSYDLMTNKYFSEVHPATKEQRDAFFTKMREAGYEWNEKTHELRKIEQNLASSAKISKDDTLLDLLNKMPSCITVDGIDYHFVLKKTVIYMAFYEGEGEGSGKVIFWMAGNPIDLLTAMLKKLKAEGLLDG